MWICSEAAYERSYNELFFHLLVSTKLGRDHFGDQTHFSRASLTSALLPPLSLQRVRQKSGELRLTSHQRDERVKVLRERIVAREQSAKQ